MRQQQDPLIKLEKISKRFGGVQALDGVSIDVSRGEVHAIVGENGAGKTTLMNILAGIYRADGGRTVLGGEEVTFRDPGDGRRHGIDVVFQELNLFPELSVVQNIFVGREMRTQTGLLDEMGMRRRALETLQQFGIVLSPEEKVTKLSMGQRQLVEITRALAHGGEIVIMDEPNSALTAKETDALFSTIGRLRSGGITVLYISHRLEEVFRIADRISVLHNGKHVATWRTEETTIPQVVGAMMGGLSIADSAATPSHPAGETLLRVEGLSGGSGLRDVNLKARSGEVIGLAGLEGSGIDDLFAVVFGLVQKSGGTVFVRERETRIRAPRDAVESGIAYVPANRREEGLMMDWPLQDNVAIVILDRMVRRGLVNDRKIGQTAAHFVDLMRIATDSLRKRVVDLSGGNQQKVVIAKWLATEADIIMMNDPARGIDVGAKAEIFSFVRDLAARRKTVLLSSSDVTELVGVCDRILVFYKGHICEEYSRERATKAMVMETMMQGTREVGQGAIGVTRALS